LATASTAIVQQRHESVAPATPPRIPPAAVNNGPVSAVAVRSAALHASATPKRLEAVSPLRHRVPEPEPERISPVSRSPFNLVPSLAGHASPSPTPIAASPCRPSASPQSAFRAGATAAAA